MDKILLSICIPTYNGGGSIGACLDAIFEARRGYEDCVEIIVSDNASEDDTYEIIQKYNEKNYKTYRNNANIGFNRNLFRLIDEYASGEYVWTIGDDDLIACQSIKLFLNYVDEMDVLFLRNELLKGSIKDVLRKERKISAEKMSYYEAVDNIASGSNLLATFMSCAIFKKKIINKINKSDITEGDWSTYPKIFPNGYLLDLGFNHSKNIYCADEVFVINLPTQREWSNRMIRIQTEIIPQFYLDVCDNKNARKKLKKTKRIIINTLLKCAIVSNESKYKKSAIISLIKIVERW